MLRHNTLAGLAGLMGVPEGAFTAEVTKYNGFVTSTVDEDFQKANTLLTRNVTTAPFFAVKIYPSAFASYTGVAVDWRGRILKNPLALDANGNWTDEFGRNDIPVPNLYGPGEISFKSLYSGTYVGGTGLTWSPARGMIAALDASIKIIHGEQYQVPSLITDHPDFDPTWDPRDVAGWTPKLFP